MRATDIILKKRGTFYTDSNKKRVLKYSEPLSKEEIEFMIQGCTNKNIPEYQIAAWLMAIFFNGMTVEETGFLTRAMLYSGEVMDFHNREAEGLHGIFVDKHSTGGVGDKISLPLAPIVAACGVQIPMMSGRALGHTGGTLDKLEAINGYKTALSPKEFARLIAKTGFAMTGQTEKIAPADRILYSLRDVTGTVESIPLITASILSKKVAEGSDALVFDVKCGSGAFMKSKEDAVSLALSLVNTAKELGKDSSALITDMSSPLGRKIGNFLEVEETIDCLNGKGPDDVMEETFALGAQMLILAKKVSTEEEGISMCKNAVSNGSALKKFLQNVEDQGGNAEELLSQVGKRRSPHSANLIAEQDGYIKIDAYKCGTAGVTLGVGRNKTSDSVCPDAGMILHKTSGEAVKKGEIIMEVFGKNEECLQPAISQLQKSVQYSEVPPEKTPLILEKLEISKA